jgi:protein-tyrosine-phosphatase
MESSKKTVLFLCTGTSARSQMAEGLLRHLAGGRYEVFSAGTNPKGMHSRAIETMKEIGIDVSNQTSKDVRDLLVKKFDYVITVCDRAKAKIAPSFLERSRSTGALTIQRTRRPSSRRERSRECVTRYIKGSASFSWRIRNNPLAAHHSMSLLLSKNRAE